MTRNDLNIDGERLRVRAERLDALAVRYRGDERLRQRLEAGDARAEVSIPGLEELPPEAEVRVVADTGEIVHFVMPPDPNAALDDVDLVGVSGGNSVSSAGTLSTAGSFPSCVSSGSTVSSGGCADIGLANDIN